MMQKNTDGLKEHAEHKSKVAVEKVLAAIMEMDVAGESINFNSISNRCGVSKTFLYNNQTLRGRIEGYRQRQVNKGINQRARYEKTSKSKDVIIHAKDKRIAELESENKRLKSQLELLRGKLYEQNGKWREQ